MATATTRRSSSWYVYLIRHVTGRSYVGATTDVGRRLRQHNGEIRGGARSTARMGPGWQLIAYLSGFSTKSAALRWEALVKKRGRGADGRLAAMLSVSMGKCPPSRTGRKQYRVPARLVLTRELQ